MINYRPPWIFRYFLFQTMHSVAYFLTPNSTPPSLDARNHIPALPIVAPIDYNHISSIGRIFGYLDSFFRGRLSTKVGTLLLLSVPYLITNFGAVPLYRFSENNIWVITSFGRLSCSLNVNNCLKNQWMGVADNCQVRMRCHDMLEWVWPHA